MAIDVRLPAARKRVNEALAAAADKSWHLVSPGDTITTDTGFMRCGAAGTCGVQGPRNVHGGRATRGVCSRSGGESQQADLCASLQDQVIGGRTPILPHTSPRNTVIYMSASS
ncbi:hypothetical protein GDO81_028145 [Engystomops pustulosus]|uniref:Uncharacterized protein n=1 Tax=Engystomops pustulosus TaxID=76066 RepID=A0AAV6Z0E2_ENGPU|nr:hypothetical protein GDO81_028145 [Engystomops pustulosus]